MKARFMRLAAACTLVLVGPGCSHPTAKDHINPPKLTFMHGQPSGSTNLQAVYLELLTTSSAAMPAALKAVHVLDAAGNPIDASIRPIKPTDALPTTVKMTPQTYMRVGGFPAPGWYQVVVSPKYMQRTPAEAMAQGLHWIDGGWAGDFLIGRSSPAVLHLGYALATAGTYYAEGLVLSEDVQGWTRSSYEFLAADGTALKCDPQYDYCFDPRRPAYLVLHGPLPALDGGASFAYPATDTRVPLTPWHQVGKDPASGYWIGRIGPTPGSPPLADSVDGGPGPSPTSPGGCATAPGGVSSIAWLALLGAWVFGWRRSRLRRS